MIIEHKFKVKMSIKDNVSPKEIKALLDKLQSKLEILCIDEFPLVERVHTKTICCH
jgi:hypothetical protein